LFICPYLPVFLNFATITIMELHEVIQYTRKKKNFTLMSLSKAAEIPYGILYRLETGKIKKPHPDLLKQISTPLELDYTELLTRSGYSIDDSQANKSVEVISFPMHSLAQLFNSKQTSTDNSIHIKLASFDAFKDAVCVSIEHNDFFPLLTEQSYVLAKPSRSYDADKLYICQTKGNKYTLGLAKQRGKKTALYSLQGLLIEDLVENFAEILFTGTR